MIVSAGTVLAADRDLTPGVVVIEDGRIVRVSAEAAPRGGLSFPDATLIPGLIDLQVNGGAGVDCLRAGAAAYDTLGRYLAATGVTAYVPTITSAPLEEMRRAGEIAAAAMRRPGALPEILGVHLEGPYLNPLRRGAHRAQDLRSPDVDEIAETVRRLEGTVRIMTLAPELENAEPAVRWLVEAGVVVAIGHTDAAFDDVQAAARWGARLVTHLFNAMRGIHHREPGAAGGALVTPALTLGVIADLAHVHPAVLALTAHAAGMSRVALVTDAVSAAGMGRGSFTLGAQTIDVRDGVPRLPDGSLAGSVLQLHRAVQNFAGAAGVSRRDAVQAASFTPAKVLGLHRRKGRIAPGMDADLVVLGRDGDVVLTVARGQIAYRRGS
ncbi:MAG TPA: N-acetylglucosamine-6-phosphate deacetylase [bacterium]|nr:N-acetylglucosamine-6-phosphate deacetylase [bacterium]